MFNFSSINLAKQFAVNSALELVKFLMNEKLSNLGVGSAEDISFSDGNAKITLGLNGESAPITLEVRGLCYEVLGGRIYIRFDELRCPEKPWIQALLNVAGTQKDLLSFPDELKFAPIKMLLKEKK